MDTSGAGISEIKSQNVNEIRHEMSNWFELSMYCALGGSLKNGGEETSKPFIPNSKFGNI